MRVLLLITAEVLHHKVIQAGCLIRKLTDYITTCRPITDMSPALLTEENDRDRLLKEHNCHVKCSKSSLYLVFNGGVEEKQDSYDTPARL